VATAHTLEPIMRLLRVAVVTTAMLTITGCGARDSLVRVGKAVPVTTPAGVPDDSQPPFPTDPGPTDTIPPVTDPSAPPSDPASTDPPRTSPPDTAPPPVTETTDADLGPPSGDIIDFADDKRERPYDRYLELVVEDLHRFWAERMPETYDRKYKPVSKVYAVSSGRRDVPGCGEARTRPEEIAGNAFFCFLEDFIAYDDDGLFPELYTKLGRTALGIVLAHEWGHAIQFRAGIDQPSTPTILLEQQADCFAGAWAAHLANGDNDELPFGDDDLKTSIVGMITVKDENGVVSEQPGAHGSAFDRVGAFQDGFTNGTTKCAGYMDSPPRTIQLPFRQGEEITGGNADLDDPNNPDRAEPPDTPGGTSGIYGLLIVDLDRFWTETMTQLGVAFTAPALAGYDPQAATPDCADVDAATFQSQGSAFCAANNTVYVNSPMATELYQAYGDYAIGYLVIAAYSEAIQVAFDSPLRDEARALANDCLVGAYTQDVLPDPNDATPGVTISAGDLDEAVQTALTASDETSTEDIAGSPFEKIAAFRRGVLDGLAACTTMLEQ
jgi:predicted metalloprotease